MSSWREFAAALAVALPMGASADIVRVDVTGVVTTGYGSIAADDAFHAAFSNDTAMAGSGSTVAYLYDAATLLDLTVGSFSYSAGSDGYQEVGDPDLVFLPDTYRAEWNPGLSGPAQGGGAPLFFSLTFEGPSTVFSDPYSLPTPSQILSLDTVEADLHFEGQPLFGGLVIDITGVAARTVVIPLPPAVWAGLAGLGLVACVRRVRRPA